MYWTELKRSKIKVYGKESSVFLHNLLTNDIKGLKPYSFNYNLRLKANGEPVEDFFVYREEDFFIIDTERDPDELINELEKLKLSLKVSFEKLDYRHFFVFEQKLPPFVFKKTDGFYTAGNPVRFGINGSDVFGRNIPALEGKSLTEKELEDIRIKHCIPKTGKELKKGFHPLEANVLYAFSFEKGCYVGQEAIARVYFRGKTPRTLVSFELRGEAVENGRIFLDGKPVGIVTSISSDKKYGLGYVLRSIVGSKNELDTENGKIFILKECLFKF
jgi:folate-binding protein YgfZ